MARVVKKLLKLFVILLALVVIVAAAALFWIDRLAEAGIEEGGKYALGVETEAEGVDLSLIYGKLTMNDLTVGNPEGDFETPYLMKFGQFSVDLDTSSLLGDVIELDHFKIADLQINIEERLTAGNARYVIQHVSDLGKRDEPSDDDDDDDSAPTDDKGKHLRVDRIVIGNTTVRYNVSLLVGKRDETIELGEIVLTNVATDGTGVPVEELIRRIVPRILIAVLDKSGDKLPADMQAGMMVLKKVLEALKIE
jgi:hypothetical protein